jgi:hypothetical protein
MAEPEIIQDTRGTYTHGGTKFESSRRLFGVTTEAGDWGDVSAALNRVARRWWLNRPWRQLLDDYADGRHQLRFVTERFGAEYARAFAGLLLSARVNLCQAVVDIFSDPVRVGAWGDESADGVARDAGLPDALAIAVPESITQGDAFVLAWPDQTGQIVPWPWVAVEVVPHPNRLNPRMMDWCAHVWPQGSDLRIDVYSLDRLTRWVLRGWNQGPAGGSVLPRGDWRPYDRDGAPAEVTYAAAGLPSGEVPVAWLKTRPTADPRAGGRSLLLNAIPLQDGMNRDLVGSMVASERAVFPDGILMGVQAAAMGNANAAALFKDGLTDAQKVALRVSAGANTGPAKFSPAKQRLYATTAVGPYTPLPQPDLPGLVAVLDAWAGRFATVLGIPTDFLTQRGSDVPSGDALQTLQTRFTASVTRWERTNTGQVNALARWCGITDPDVSWGPVIIPSQAQQDTHLLALRQAGVPLEDALRICGFPDAAQIADRARAESAAAGAAFRAGLIA